MPSIVIGNVDLTVPVVLIGGGLLMALLLAVLTKARHKNKK